MKLADSLIDKIKKYVKITNYLGEPRTDEDEEVLSKLIDKNRMFNYEPLNLNDVVQLGLDIGADNIRESIDFYKKLAEEIEIEYIDADMDVIETPEVEVTDIEEVEEKPKMKEEAVCTTEETELMQIPKVGLSDKTLKQISKSTDKIVGAIKELKTTQKKNDEAEETEETVMEIEESSEAYSIEQREEDVIGIPFSKVKRAIDRGMNIIYRGVPGCGKTRTAKCDAKAIIGKVESNRIKQIDFTENLDYTDTMVGMKQSEDGQWRYVKGSIAKFCEFADRNRDKIFVLILNEFTRANTEAVLGQMFTAMENKYRDEKFVLDSGDKFVCPKNLVILATMNGTDKGVKKLDKATEERFYIIDVKPLWVEWATNRDAFDRLIDTLEITIDSDEYKIVEKLCEIMSNINISCEEGGMLTADHQIGQRQLMQFVGQKGLDSKPIKYNKETLGIVIEQLLSRVNQLKEMNNSIEKHVDELSKLLERCNG